MRFKLLVVLLAGCSFPVFAQTETDVVIEQIIESLADKVTEDFDFAELTERLHYFRKHPININKTSSEELIELIFLTPVQVNELLDHRRINGDFIDLLELQSLETFDAAIIKQLLPFITIRNENAMAGFNFRNLKRGSHDLILRYGQVLQSQTGYALPDNPESSRYLGSRPKILVRYRYNLNNNLLVSLNMEKDAGEQFFAGKQSAGFDFYSGSLFFKKLGKIEKLAVGDYSLQFGQGLSLWSGLSFSKGADAAGAAKQEFGLKPYTSVNEALYFRGVAATIKFNRFYFSPFVSYRDVDAILTNGNEITSLGVSGFHRTETELGHKNAGTEFLAGGALQFKSSKLKLGVTGYHVVFDKPFEAGRFLYNQFEFTGNRLFNFGFNYSYNLRNTYFFGEAAHSLNSGLAFINGAITSLSPEVSAVVLHRHYDRNYHSFFNQALSEASTAINERAVYSGLVLRPAPRWEVSAYFDVFKFPWLKFVVDAPSKGYEVLSQITYSPTKRIKMSGRYRIEQKEENDDLDAAVNTLQPVRKENYRLELSYKINDALSVRSRAEVSGYKKGGKATEFGQVLFQDLIYNPLSSKLSGNIRFALFDTPGFDTRIYTYENDVLYSYSMMSYQNHGFRFYANGRYTLKRGLDLWLRFAMISYPQETKIGSGLEQINGNRKSDIKFQIRYQF